MIWQKFGPYRWILALMLVLAIPVPAMALLVRPVLMDLKSTGPGASGSFEVVNDRNRPITVEISVSKLAIPERGEVVLAPDDGANFQIFPPIASIPAGKRQIFRIKWIGAPDIPQSETYMFSTAELPVKRTAEEDATTGVEILYAINSVVAVAPANQKPDVSISSVVRKIAKDGRVGLDVTFLNEGSAHGFVSKGQLVLEAKSAGWSKTILESEVSNAFGLGLVPPHQKRAMFIAIPDAPEANDITAEFRPIRGRDRRER